MATLLRFVCEGSQDRRQHCNTAAMQTEERKSASAVSSTVRILLLWKNVFLYVRIKRNRKKKLRVGFGFWKRASWKSRFSYNKKSNFRVWRVSFKTLRKLTLRLELNIYQRAFLRLYVASETKRWVNCVLMGVCRVLHLFVFDWNLIKVCPI